VRGSLALALALALVFVPAPPLHAGASAGGRTHGSAALEVWRDGAWRPLWRGDQAPERWSGADPDFVRSLVWTPVAAGLEWSSARLACAAPAWRQKLIIVRLDPRKLRLSLELDLTRDQQPAWTIDRVPGDAVFGVNAGQFARALPWGWVAMDGVERFHAGLGPLSSAIAIDHQGIVSWTHGGAPAASGVVAGFQSYPTLLAGDGVVPAPLRSGLGVNVKHRDARLALGSTRDGRLLIVMTRFDALGAIASGIPLGPTTPEMAAIMGALGASDAVMLDGGISAQLAMRDPKRGATLRWPGIRKVPLGLIARSPD